MRDELKKMQEFKDLDADFSTISCPFSELEKLKALGKVPMDVIIDIIIYCSKGDKDLAIRSLRTSKQFVDRCLNFLQGSDFPHFYAYDLFVQIWLMGFIATECVLEYDSNKARMVPPTHEVLEDVLVMLNETELLYIAAEVTHSTSLKLAWIETMTNQFREKKLVFNKEFKKLKDNSNFREMK